MAETNTKSAAISEADEGGATDSGLTDIHLHTSGGDATIQYDPSTLEVDADIGVVCTTLQILRDMGILADATIVLRTQDGIETQFILSEVELVD